MRFDRDLEEKISVVTGAANGIGYAIAERLATAGSRVCLVDIDGSRLAEAADSIASAGGASVLGCVESDLSSVAGIAEAFKQVVKLTSTLDVLVNNAGGSQGTPIRLEDVSEQDYENVLNLNLRACFFATQAAVPLMLRPAVAQSSILPPSRDAQESRRSARNTAPRRALYWL